MSFFNKSPEAWQKLADKEIDIIVKRLSELTVIFNDLLPKMNEFKNAVEMLKKNKKPILAQNIHLRAQGILKDLNLMRAELKKITTVSKELEKSEDKAVIMEPVYTVMVKSPGGNTLSFKLKKKEPLILGRDNIQGLSTHFSRKHVEISASSLEFATLTNIGINDIGILMPAMSISRQKGQSFSIPINQKIVVYIADIDPNQGMESFSIIIKLELKNAF